METLWANWQAIAAAGLIGSVIAAARMFWRSFTTVLTAAALSDIRHRQNLELRVQVEQLLSDLERANQSSSGSLTGGPTLPPPRVVKPRRIRR